MPLLQSGGALGGDGLTPVPPSTDDVPLLQSGGTLGGDGEGAGRLQSGGENVQLTRRYGQQRSLLIAAPTRMGLDSGDVDISDFGVGYLGYGDPAAGNLASVIPALH